MNRKLLLVAAGIAVLTSMAAAAPARADDWGRHRGWREHEWREHEWRERHRWGGPSYYVAPGYAYAPPPVIYAQPRVVYPPPVVYAPAPPPSLNIIVPIR